MKKVQMSFTTNSRTKKNASKIAQKLGISLSTVLNMCLVQMEYQHGLPFKTKLPDDNDDNNVHVTTPKELNNIINNAESDLAKRRAK